MSRVRARVGSRAKDLSRVRSRDRAYLELGLDVELELRSRAGIKL